MRIVPFPLVTSGATCREILPLISNCITLPAREMKLFGITGGVGMGKSASARLLTAWGFPVVDTDVLARQLVEPGQPALAEILTTFGAELVDASGQLRRDALAQIVFAYAEQKRRLEAILHPRIRAAWKAETSRWRAEAKPLGAVIIPLLFETGAMSEFDRILCVACQPATQRRRLAERGWSEAEMDRRIASQWPVSKKIEGSHHVIWTEPSLDVHAAQLARLVDPSLGSGSNPANVRSP